MLFKRLMLLVLGSWLLGTGATATCAEQTSKGDKPKYVEKKKQDKSLIDSVSSTLGNAMGILSLEGRTEGEEGVPRKIAVLPAVGQGDERERDDIRTAIHNNLSSKNFDLLKPYDIDRMLAQFEQADGKNHRDYDPQELAQKLNVEGLVFVDVPLVEQVYAAAYAHYKITIKLSFYSSFDNNFIWEKEESIAERAGGISLDPLSFIAQAISSAQVLTEAVRQTLVDKLARIFASDIPFPIGKRAKIKPVKINLALSNVAEGPFRAGDEISVFMRAEPGLAATFDIGNRYKGFPMVEQGEGEYVGRYVVSDNDSEQGATVRIHAKRIDDNAQIVWRVPGRIGIDTQPPAAIVGLTSSPVKDAIQLNWTAQASSHETLTYHIQRADPDTGIYEELTAINIQEFTDDNIIEGIKYHYRLYAQDEAGNQSPFSNIQVAAVGVGPTQVLDDLIGDSVFYPVASPYVIDKPIRVLRNATLTLSPGTIIEFKGEGKLEVLGQIKALGTSQSPITLNGEGVNLLFSNTGENTSQFSFSQFNSGKIDLNQSSVSFNQSLFKAMTQAIGVHNNSKLVVNNSEFVENQIGLLVEDGQVELAHVKFVSNQLAWQVTGRQTLSAKVLNFEDNDIHIDSAKPMILGNAIFNEPDHQTLQSKLKGEVTIDFSKVADKHNLLNKWLKQRWVSLLEAANNGLWQQTYQELQAIRGQETNPRIDAFNETLKFVTGRKVARSSNFIRQVQGFAETSDKGRLWVQELKVHYSKNTEKSDGYIKKQAAKKLTRSYLKQNFAGLRPAELRKYKRKIKVEQHTIDSQVIYTMKKGPFLHVWIAHYLDMEKIDRSLTMAGLIKKTNSELVVGLLSDSDVFAFEELIVKALKKQGIKYINLGTGSYGTPIQKRAKKMGANVVLETEVMVEESKSGISKSLKIADVNLVLDLYDVQTNDVLDHLSASANKAGFKMREIVKKAVIESYGIVESKLLTALWAADDIVVEHNKKRRARLAAEKAAKEKAAKEQKRLAKLAAEKAAKEKAAREKAAREAAEAQRIAAEKAAREKAAREEALRLAAIKAEQQKAAEQVAAPAQTQMDDPALETDDNDEQDL